MKLGLCILSLFSFSLSIQAPVFAFSLDTEIEACVIHQFEPDTSDCCLQ